MVKKNAAWTGPVGKNIPRKIYGEYLREYLEGLINESQAESHKNQVTQIHLEADNRLAAIYGDKKQIFDVVHLCVGHLPYSDPYHLAGKENYIDHPYPVNENLKNIPNRSKVGILGTGLTAIDLALYLQKEKEHVDIHFTSLDSAFGAVKGKGEPVHLTYFSKEQIFHERQKNNGFIPLETMVDWFNKEVKLHGIALKKMWYTYGEGTIEGLKRDMESLNEIGQFQSIIHQLDDVLPELWESLRETDKEQFLTKYGRKWEKFRSPVPKQTALKLINFYDKGKIHLAGHTKDIIKENESFSVELENERSIQVDYVINATGQKKNLSLHEEEMPLVKQLLDEQLLQKEPFGGVQVTWPHLSAISHRHGILPQLKVHGQLISGIQFGNNTMGMISLSAAAAVEDMFCSLRKNSH